MFKGSEPEGWWKHLLKQRIQMRRLKDNELSFDYTELRVHRILNCETAYVIKHRTIVVQKPEFSLQF